MAILRFVGAPIRVYGLIDPEHISSVFTDSQAMITKQPSFPPPVKAVMPDGAFIIPFGAGPRACLGAGLAPLVMRTVLALCLARYRFTFVPRFNGDPIIDFGFGLSPKDGIEMRISPR